MQYLHSNCVSWCTRTGIRPSTVEPFSYLVHQDFGHVGQVHVSCSPMVNGRSCGRCYMMGASILQHLPQLPICNFDALIADEVLFVHACCDNTAQGLQKLGVDALAFDYPLGPSKGYATRVVLLSRKGLSHEPCSCPVFKMQVPAFIPGWLGLQISSSRHLFLHRGMKPCMAPHLLQIHCSCHAPHKTKPKPAP